jgi:F-type H+-transporting ATPase subunit epsilon
MASEFDLQIISPHRVEFEGKAESVIVPGEAGYLGILANHAPLLATIGKGDLTVRLGSDLKYYHVNGGFVEVQGNRVVVLVQEFEPFEPAA